MDEMTGMIEEMSGQEQCSILGTEFFNELLKMLDEKTLLLEDVVLLLKQWGFRRTLKCNCNLSDISNSLCKKFDALIIEEEEKKEEKNEKHLVELYECYLILQGYFNSRGESISAILSGLLKVALSKEENEETQKEVEMALLALSCIREDYIEVEQRIEHGCCENAAIYDRSNKRTGRVDEIWNRRDFAGLAARVAGLYEAAKDGKHLMCRKCVFVFHFMAKPVLWITELSNVLIESGAIACALDCVIRQPLVNEDTTWSCFIMFSLLCFKLRGKAYREFNTAKWKIKKTEFEKMEEEGYDDIMIGFRVSFPGYFKRYHQIIV
ncbi:uncharacterized protein MONOS_12007 [Monocercomonoides exilis]|uniref:uncharacterized protein n=1 Tax=Monocercomonoides exilis TaxID=2049356 RepID=UPI00355A62F2|nr:hypothetical protein MONOS_12007 [Monocercomonoides exilis]|eukprot:MONOS_12007.1-p1 / transcript=MONOS_12007.1 / gene=MONOS_12007 / organism=Monocercomonoides_exilis_PA203 / gene_product=unspecified product / transcript_product=unspecified product / location=Mono_scaffold00636:6568-7817(-) / protein_length=323 / sequence_SO=supercontig / SO=protein_coding / is_pseudo=false